MQTRSQRQFAAIAVVASVTLLILGKFDLSRLGAGTEYSLDLRLLGVTACCLVLIPWWLSFHVPRRNLAPAILMQLSLTIFLLFMSISSTWFARSTGDYSTLYDFAYLWCLSLLFMMPFTVAPQESAEVVLKMFAGVSWIYTLGGLAVATSVDRISFLGGGPNIYGRIVGLGLVATIALVALGRMPRWLLAVAPLQIAAVALSGSRGAMAATTIGTIVVVAPHIRQLISIRSVVAFAGTALLLWSQFGERIIGVVQYRIVRLTFEEGYSSGRDALTPIAIGLFRESPIAGGGLGSFGDRAGDSTLYAHNIILQVLAEGGTLGLLLFLLTVAPAFILMCRAVPESGAALGLAAMSLVVFVASMFSGSYYDFRLMWAFAFAGAMVALDLRGPVHREKAASAMVGPDSI